MQIHHVFRNVRRAQQIARILVVKYRFGRVAAQLGLSHLLPLASWRARAARGMEKLQPAVRVRLALADLGPAFVKLGQLLSTRADFVPAAFISELRKLQDQVPPLPFEQMRPVLEEELGAGALEHFASFDPEPLASASIGQVYAAVLRDGEAVTVKIQRPEVEQAINTDLGVLADLAELVHTRFPGMRRYQLSAFIRELGGILRDELNYTLEAHNADTLQKVVAEDPRIYVPDVIWPFTGRRVLTTERVQGTPLDREALLAKGVDPGEVAAALAHSLLTQIFLHGFFHGDPHQGNVLVMDDGRIALLDLGIIGSFDRSTLHALVELLVAVFDRDSQLVLDQLMEIGVMGESVDFAGLRRDLGRLLTRYYFLPRHEFRLGELFNRIIALMLSQRLNVPPEFSLLGKTLMVTEGVGRELDPDFDFNRVAEPVVARLRAQRGSLDHLLQDLSRALREFRRQLIAIPRRLNHVLSQAQSGTLRIRTQDENAERWMALQSAVLHRVGAMAIVGSLVIAYTIFISSPAGDAWSSPWRELAGVAIGVLAFFGLTFSFLRSQR